MSIQKYRTRDRNTKANKHAGNSDAFKNREKANEDYAIRQREKEKLIALQKVVKEQQQHLAKLSEHM